MNLRYKVTPIEGVVSVDFAQDFKIEIAFLDSKTQAVIADFTGDHSVSMSALLAAMPADALAEFVDEVAVRMVTLVKDVDANV